MSVNLDKSVSKTKIAVKPRTLHAWNGYNGNNKTRCGIPSPLPKHHVGTYKQDGKVTCLSCRSVMQREGEQFVRYGNIGRRPARRTS